MTFEDAANEFKRIAKELAEVDKAIKSVPESSDAPEQIAAALGQDMERMLDPRTPLAETEEIAQMEMDEKVLSRAEKLKEIIAKKIEG